LESLKEKEKRKLSTLPFNIVFGVFLLFCMIKCYTPRTALQAEARKYQSHKKFEDTSFLYDLPYEANTCHRIIQGYFSRYTHKYKAALDFRMKKGTPVLAVRDGIVVRTKDDSNVGGWNKKYRGDANYIVIEHADSTRSSYRHLMYKGVLVKVGTQVSKGEKIGYSGNTGYTFSPHLHFMITRYEKGQWVTVPCRFKTHAQEGYLQPLKSHTSLNIKKDLSSPSRTEQIIAN